MTAQVPAPLPEDEELPGLAGERTEMAWSRSGLALGSAAGAVGKLLLTERVSPTATIAIYVLLAIGVVCWGAALLHAQLVARDMLEGRRVDNRDMFRIVTIGTVTFALGALVLAVLHHP